VYIPLARLQLAALWQQPQGGPARAEGTGVVRAPGEVDEDGWVIDGQKRFITNAPIADLFTVFARTRPAREGDPGIAVFLVPATTPGVSVGPKDAKMGQEGAWFAHHAGGRLTSGSVTTRPDLTSWQL
jgi:alkylation response protein AidB-like acyl-CoA dehydrogenase